MNAWIPVILGCLICADAGFLCARLARSTSVQQKLDRYRRPPHRAAPSRLERSWPPTEGPPVAGDARAVTPRGRKSAFDATSSRSVPRSPARRPAATVIPTVARPEDRELTLWAGQIEAGLRKMTRATDGCRVTWDRSCKHGHPSWLVHLEYLAPPSASSYEVEADSTPR
jgi:hypothetical protein